MKNIWNPIPMTEREAIDGLKNLFSEHELDLPGTDSLEILHMAVTAMERYIPKKMMCKVNFNHKIEAKSFTDTSGSCPGCGYRSDCGEIGSKYCPWCGQALDWSEE